MESNKKLKEIGQNLGRMLGKMLDGRATTESANGQDPSVQSANHCNHL